jgi:Fe-S cluster assembly iron-binding protein IscA
LGMALEESVDGLEGIEANGVTAYIDPNLRSFLDQFGQVNVDYVDNGLGSRGFTVRVGAGTSGCSSCGSDSSCS